MPEQHPPRAVDDGPPPFGGSWTLLYLVVGGVLLGLIALFWLFTRAFA
ncbi:MAG: hypothetical protein ACM3O7_06715 [Acidobacteriota bacterium]